MKTVRLSLSKQAVSDRGLQITEITNFLNRTAVNSNDYQEINENEIQEIEPKEDGECDLIYWIVGQPVEVENGVYEFQLEC